MNKYSLLTQEYLKECFNYNPDNGALTWKVRPRHHFNKEMYWNRFNNIFSGKRVTSKVTNKTGIQYYTCTVSGFPMHVHRLVWIINFGKVPNVIDHIDGDGLNNSLINLRNVTQAENFRNSKIKSNNTSGFTGVYWCTCTNKWKAEITKNKKTTYIGVFDNKNDAAIARKMAEHELGFSKRHGT